MARRHRTPAGRRSLDSLSDFISDLRGIGEGAGPDPACGIGLASNPVLSMGGSGPGFRGAFHSSLDNGHAPGLGGRAMDGYGPAYGPLSHRSSTGSLPSGQDGSIGASLRGPEGDPYGRFLDPRRGAFAGFAGQGTAAPEAREHASPRAGAGGATSSGGATRGLLEMLHYGDPRQQARQRDSLLPSAGRFPCAAGATSSSGLPAIRLKVRLGPEGREGGARFERTHFLDGSARELQARDPGAAVLQPLEGADADIKDPAGPSLAPPPSGNEVGTISSSPFRVGAGRSTGGPGLRRPLLRAGSRIGGASERGGPLGHSAGVRSMGGTRRLLGAGMVRRAVLGKRPFSAYSALATSSVAGASAGPTAGRRLKGLLSAGTKGSLAMANSHTPRRALPGASLGALSARPGASGAARAARARPGAGPQDQLSLAELMPPPPPRRPKPGLRHPRRAAGAPLGVGKRLPGPPLLSRRAPPWGQSATAGVPPGDPTVATGSEKGEALGSRGTGSGSERRATGEAPVPLATALVQTKAAAEAALRAVGLAGFGIGVGAGAAVPLASSLWDPRHTVSAEQSRALPGGAHGAAAANVGAAREVGMGPEGAENLADAFGVPRELQGEFLEELLQVARVRCVEKEVAGAAREFVAQRKQLLDDFCTELLRLHSSERFAMVPSADPPALLLPAVGTREEVAQVVLRYCADGDNLQSLCLWLCHMDRPNSLAGTCSAAVAVERAHTQLAEDSHPSTTSMALRRARREAPLTVLLKLHQEWDAARKSRREAHQGPVTPFLVPMPS